MTTRPAPAVVNGHAGAVERVAVSVYSIPTDAPEADGTFRWEAPSLVLAVASGFSCPTRIAQGGARQPRHIAEVIAGARPGRRPALQPTVDGRLQHSGMLTGALVAGEVALAVGLLIRSLIKSPTRTSGGSNESEVPE